MKTANIPTAVRPQSRRGRSQQVAMGADYDAEELEFLRAVDTYKRETGRAFPTWTEILTLFKTLGYRKVTT